MLEDKIFRDRSIVVYLSYAPAGFGHLRVADAFYHGLPEYVTPILLGTTDTSVTLPHRLTSVHPILRAFFVWGQSGFRDRLFATVYRRYLHSTAKNIKLQLLETISQRIDPVETIIIVATHFGIAHQVSFIKNELERALSIKIILVVQVTDDSPQFIWYVHHADLIFVPSEKTADVFLAYDKRKTKNKPKIVVSPYPISPYLGRALSGDDVEKRISQLTPGKDREIQMMIPLSGAAVGTKSIEELIKKLKRKNDRFFFHVVVKDAPYTKYFLERLKHYKTFVKVYSSKNDKSVVNLYEDVYMSEIISLEITKPSEQAFKALYYPKQRGGSILLFASPVGRQEFDNLDFLVRHKLVPSNTEHAALWELARQENFEKSSPMYKAIIAGCRNWRGLILPKDPEESSEFILWCLEHEVFKHMANHEKPHQEPPHYDNELSPNGVAQFWQVVSEYAKKNLYNGQEK